MMMPPEAVGLHVSRLFQTMAQRALLMEPCSAGLPLSSGLMPMVAVPVWLLCAKSSLVLLQCPMLQLVKRLQELIWLLAIGISSALRW